MPLSRHWPGPTYHHAMRWPPTPPGDRRESATTQGLGAGWVYRGDNGRILDIGLAMEPLFPELEGNRYLRMLCTGQTPDVYPGE